MSFFDSPRTRPRYRGVSDPIPRSTSAHVCAMAQHQAVQRMYLDWARSPNRERWLPEQIKVRVVDDDPDLFIRGQRAVAVTAVGAAVFDADELARMDAPLEVVRDDG